MNPSQTNKIRSGAVEVVRHLRERGFIAYFAGGCVRDEVLGRPAKDYDIATSATPDEVEGAFARTHAIGKAFGVIQVMLHDHPYEVATFRQDREYPDGRRPEASSSARRTRTRGAGLHHQRDVSGSGRQPGHRFCRRPGRHPPPRDPCDRRPGGVLRGVTTCACRGRCTCGDARFAIEPATMDAIRHHAPKIVKVSCERIQQELTRLLTESLRPGDAVEVLRELACRRRCCQRPCPWWTGPASAISSGRGRLDAHAHHARPGGASRSAPDVGDPAARHRQARHREHRSRADGVPRIRFDGQ
ncbi:MAG: hypothetical protein U1F77_08545 [Kiritimatiellia bacterium]